MILLYPGRRQRPSTAKSGGLHPALARRGLCLPNQEHMAALRAALKRRTEQASASARKVRKYGLNGEALAKGNIDTREYEAYVQELHQIGGSLHSPHREVAHKLELIFRHFQRRSFDSIGKEAQFLVRAGNKVVRQWRTKNDIFFTEREKTAIEYYYPFASKELGEK